MYGITKSGKRCADELTNWLIYDTGFNQSICQNYVKYNYAPYDSKLVVLSYVDDCVYWYTSEEPGKWFVDTLGKIFQMNFLGYAYWFVFISISQLTKLYMIHLFLKNIGTLPQ